MGHRHTSGGRGRQWHSAATTVHVDRTSSHRVEHDHTDDDNDPNGGSRRPVPSPECGYITPHHITPSNSSSTSNLSTSSTTIDTHTDTTATTCCCSTRTHEGEEEEEEMGCRRVWTRRASALPRRGDAEEEEVAMGGYSDQS